MRVLVCGGRDWVPTFEGNELFLLLDGLVKDADSVVVIQGGAGGADWYARYWAQLRGHECVTFRPEWRKYRRAAGPIRNKMMLDIGRPDVVVATPGGRGTADMIARAKEAGVPVIHT